MREYKRTTNTQRKKLLLCILKGSSVSEAAKEVGLKLRNAKTICKTYATTGTWQLKNFRIRQKRGESREDVIQRRDLPVR